MTSTLLVGGKYGVTVVGRNRHEAGFGLYELVRIDFRLSQATAEAVVRNLKYIRFEVFSVLFNDLRGTEGCICRPENDLTAELHTYYKRRRIYVA